MRLQAEISERAKAQGIPVKAKSKKYLALRASVLADESDDVKAAMALKPRRAPKLSKVMSGGRQKNRLIFATGTKEGMPSVGTQASSPSNGEDSSSPDMESDDDEEGETSFAVETMIVDDDDDDDEPPFTVETAVGSGEEQEDHASVENPVILKWKSKEENLARPFEKKKKSGTMSEQLMWETALRAEMDHSSTKRWRKGTRHLGSPKDLLPMRLFTMR